MLTLNVSVRSPDLHQLFASTDSSRPLTRKSRKSVVVARIAGLFNECIGLFRVNAENEDLRR